MSKKLFTNKSLLEGIQGVIPSSKLFVLNANNFDLSFQDINYSLDRKKDNSISPDLVRWIDYKEPFNYLGNVNMFVNYLSYVLYINILTSIEFDLIKLESYFTEQVLSYSIQYNDEEARSNIYNYWTIVSNRLEEWVLYAKGFDSITAYFPIQLLEPDKNKVFYEQYIPFVGHVNKIDKHIHIILCFNNNKPQWYHVPFMFKVLGYFQKIESNISVIKISWLDNTDVNNMITEYVTVDNNVLTLVNMYKNISPLPFVNIFDSNNSDLTVEEIIKYPRLWNKE